MLFFGGYYREPPYPGHTRINQVDERSKATLDNDRSYRHGHRLFPTTEEAIGQLLGREGVDLNTREHDRLDSAVISISSTLSSVANGGPHQGTDAVRKEFLVRARNSDTGCATTESAPTP